MVDDVVMSHWSSCFSRLYCSRANRKADASETWTVSYFTPPNAPSSGYHIRIIELNLSCLQEMLGLDRSVGERGDEAAGNDLACRKTRDATKSFPATVPVRSCEH